MVAMWCHLAKTAGQGAECGRTCEQFRWQEIHQRKKAERIVAGDAVLVHGVVLLSSRIEPFIYNRHKCIRIVPAHEKLYPKCRKTARGIYEIHPFPAAESISKNQNPSRLK